MKVCQLGLLMVGLLAVSWLFNSRSVAAEELQITDYLGLIRAQRNIHDKVTVRISVIHNPRLVFNASDPGPLLTQRTGFSGDIEAIKADQYTYVFSGVSPGVWRIRLRNKALLLDSVEVIDRNAADQGAPPVPTAPIGEASPAVAE